MALDDWKKRLRPGSFRGVPFHVVPAYENQFGIRGVTHEFINRDKPYREELGKQAEGFTVEVIIGGPDYMDVRDKLKEALLKGGPGKLVHPYLGELTVKVLDNCSLVETTAEGGLARFSLKFVESGEETYPASTVDHSRQASDQATTVLSAAGQVFQEVYTIRGPEYLATTFLEDVRAAANLARRSVRAVAATVGLDAVLEVIDTAATLTAAGIRTAASVVSQVQGVAAAVASISSPADALAAFRAVNELAQFGEVLISGHPVSRLAEEWIEIPLTTATRAIQAANRTALSGLVRVAAVAEAARTALNLAPAGYRQAVELRDGVNNLIVGEMKAAGDAAQDDLYQALWDLQQATVPPLTELAVNLPKLTTYPVPPGGRSAVLVAFDLYGDLDRADEILLRNGLAGGDLIQGDTVLEVLSA